MLHGDLDKPVPLEQSELLKQLLDKYGVENQLFVEQGVGHSAPVFDTEKCVRSCLFCLSAPPSSNLRKAFNVHDILFFAH
jgi:hypothetical protein